MVHTFGSLMILEDHKGRIRLAGRRALAHSVRMALPMANAGSMEECLGVLTLGDNTREEAVLLFLVVAGQIRYIGN
jgi:hypothetical protein